MAVSAEPAEARLSFSVLGSLSVTAGGHQLRLGGAKARTLLALLGSRPGEIVSTGALIDGLWSDDPPPSAEKSLQVYIARLRRVLEPSVPPGGPFSVLTTEGAGYVLRVDPESVDAARFESLATRGRDALRDGDPARAAALLRDAIQLWRGPAYEGFDGPSQIQFEQARLEDLRATAFEDLTSAELDLGRTSEIVAPLERAVREHPFRERLWANLMVALYRAGRQADALHSYQRARETLVEELGVEPGAELRALEAAVLDHDASLLLPGGSRAHAAVAAAAAPAPGASGIDPAELDRFLDVWSDVASGRRRIVTRRRLRVLGTVIAALTVGTVAVVAVAVDSRSKAERSETRANREARASIASDLATRSRALQHQRSDLALLLATEAHALTPTPETEGALVAALVATPPQVVQTVALTPKANLPHISSDGTLIAAPDDGGGVRIVELPTGKEQRRLRSAPSGALGADFSADGRTVAFGSASGAVTVWNVADGRAVATLDAGPGPAYGVFDPTTGEHVFTASHDGTITKWELRDGQQPDRRVIATTTPARDPGLPLVLVVSRDGTRLLAGDLDGPSVVLDAASGTLVAQLDGNPGALSSDGSLAATARPGVVTVTDLATGATAGTPVRSVRLPSPFMSFDPNGELLAIGDIGDRRVHVADWRTGQDVIEPFDLFTERPLPVFLDDGRLFVRTASRAALLDLSKPAVAPIARDFPTEGGFAAFSGDGRTVMTVGENQVRLWDASDASLRGELQVPGVAGSVLAVPSPDHRMVLIVRPGTTVELLDRRTGRSLGELVHPGRIGAAWSPDSSAVALVFSDGEVLVWPVNRSEPRRVEPAGEPDVPPYLTSIAWRPDSRRLIVVREKAGAASTFDVASGRRTRVLQLEPGLAMRQAAYRPDGRAIAIAVANEGDGSGGGAIRIVDAATGAVRDELPLAHDPNGIAYYDGGRRLATLQLTSLASPPVTGAAALQLWDAERLVPIGDPAPFPAAGFLLTASPDGRRVLHPAGAGRALLWDLDPRTWTERACRLAARRLTRAEWKRYLPGFPYDPVCR